MIDPLTEMYNRRYIMRAIASETARADRQNSQFAFLMIDLDDFKRANDVLGHLAGDRILRELSALLRNTFRTSEIISRFGGDEFLVLLIESDQEMAVRAAERLQEAVAEWNKGEPIKGYTMAVSCGSAVYERLGPDGGAHRCGSGHVPEQSRIFPRTSRAASFSSR